MSENPDLELAIARVLQNAPEPLVKEGLTALDGIFQTEAGNVLVRGDVLGGVAVKITDALAVEGSVVGEISKPCRIEAVGDVIITGKVHHAEIRARTIHIGGEVRSSELVSCERIDVECDLIDVNVAAGDLEFCARRARDHQLRFAQHRAKLEMLKKQLERDEVQLHKQCERTSKGLKFGAAAIVLHEPDRIRIDRGKLYKLVGDKGEEEVTAALKEFFAKGLIGLVGRLNRAYIARNPAHERVFLQLIQGLRKLVFLSRRVDVLMREMECEREALSELVKRINRTDRVVSVRGKVYPDTSFGFLPLDVVISAEGDIASVGRRAELRVSTGSDTSRRALKKQGSSGQEETEMRSADELREIALRLDGDYVVWGPLDEFDSLAV